MTTLFRQFIACGLSLVAAGACSSPTAATTPSPLDGVWSSHLPGSGVGVVLTLVWTPDSVHGAGTYDAVQSSLGCGGGTLQGSGNVTLRAARSDTVILGSMTFDNGWTPPYRGSLENGSHISGAFQSIDAGPCQFDLFHGLVP